MGYRCSPRPLRSSIEDGNTRLGALARGHQALRAQLNAPKQQEYPRSAYEIPVSQPFGILRKAIEPFKSKPGHPWVSAPFKPCTEIYGRAYTQREATGNPPHFEFPRDDLLLRRPYSQETKPERAE